MWYNQIGADIGRTIIHKRNNKTQFATYCTADVFTAERFGYYDNENMMKWYYSIGEAVELS